MHSQPVNTNPNFTHSFLTPGLEDFLSDGVSAIPRAQILSQWNKVSADGKISKSEMLGMRELCKHITDTLGYRTIDVFLHVHSYHIDSDSAGQGSLSLGVFGEISLSPESMTAINASIQGSVFGGHQFTASLDNKLPLDIDPAATFVVFTLPGGEEITFDGPVAGKTAAAFATIYNNSPTFRDDITDLANKQDGQYSFHMVPMDDGVGGSNTAGTGRDKQNSGVRISYALRDGSEPSSDKLSRVIIHEVAHDLHPGRGYKDDGTPHAGEGPHAREQTIYHGLIVNELKSAGIDINYDVDGDDYSHDSRVFGSKGVSSIDTIVVAGHEVNALETYSKMYQYTKLMINEVGSYEEAKKILDQIPADAQITIVYDNPQEGWKDTQVTYNVRELMLQDLMFSADRADRFDMNVDDKYSKEALGGFFNYLVGLDAAWESTIQTAANDIFFDLKEEFPDYV